MRRLIVSIRESDERKVEAVVLQLGRKSRILAPAVFVVSAFVMLFSGLRLLATNWRLMLVQVLPAMLLWAVTLDLRVHLLGGREFRIVQGPLVLAVFSGVVLVTTLAFFFNAVFAFTICQPGPPLLRTGFEQARSHVAALLSWGTGTGLALGIAAAFAPHWGPGWFAVLLGTVLGLMMLCYVAVPARIVGVPSAKLAKVAERPRDRVAATVVIGALGAIVCAPPYAMARLGLVLLDSRALFWFGVALLIIGLMLQAGITGAVKAVKVSAKLLAGWSRDPGWLAARLVTRTGTPCSPRSGDSAPPC